MSLESTFSAQFRNDTGLVYGKDVDCMLIVDAPRSNKKDCDAIICLAGKPYAIEFKKTDGGSFAFSQVRNNQVISLIKKEKAGYQSWIVINFHKYKTAIAIRISAWLSIVKEFENERTSLKFEEYCDAISDIQLEDKKWAEYGQIIKRKKINGKTRWEIETLIN